MCVKYEELGLIFPKTASIWFGAVRVQLPDSMNLQKEVNISSRFVLTKKFL